MSFEQDDHGCYVVTTITPGGNTNATGRVEVGYRILEIAGVSLNGVEKAVAINMIKEGAGGATGSTGKCTFTFLKGTLVNDGGSNKGFFRAAGGTPEIDVSFVLIVDTPLGVSFDLDDQGHFVVTKVTPGGNIDRTGKVSAHQLLN